MQRLQRSTRDACVLLALGALHSWNATADVLVNEVLGSTPSSDREFIELYNPGSETIDISGWQVTLYDSDAGSTFGGLDGGSPYVVPGGTTVAAGGYFLFANTLAETDFLVTADAPLPGNAIENSSYTVALTDAAGTLLQSILVSDGDAGDVANAGAGEITPDASFGPDGPFLPAGFTLNLDTGAPAGLIDFGDYLNSATPRASTDTPLPAPLPASIMAIQGRGHISPLVDQRVVTQGVVTAVDSNLFFLQDPVGDGDIATSDGIQVFTGSSPTVTVGELVEVNGTVSEFTPGGSSTRNLTTTQISRVNSVVAIDTTPLPEPVVLGAEGRVPPSENIDDDAFAAFEPETDGIDFFESVEGMRVTIPGATAIAPANRFGEIFTTGDAGTLATGISRRGTLNIAPDDFNPEKIQVDEDRGILDFDIPVVDTGATLGDVTGVVGYGFGNFEVYPTEPFEAISGQLRAERTRLRPQGNRLTVASYNVLNLDPNDDDGDMDIANGRFDAIARHIVHNLRRPDIIGLQEIQDNDGADDTDDTAADITLQTLVDAIEAAGGPGYAFRDTADLVPNSVGGQPGGNIRVAFLYNPERVSLVGDVEALTDTRDQSINPANPFFGSRVSLAGVFRFRGREITVVNNHFSSKGGSAPILGIEQPFDQRQEDVAVNGSLDERQRQAAAVADYVDDILSRDRRARVIVLGDLNEFEFISPVADILGSRLTNTTDQLPAKERYSFIFQGNSQSLDHVLLSDSLLGGAKVDIVHVNAEFRETPQRASDHDPIVVSVVAKGRPERDDEDDD